MSFSNSSERYEFKEISFQETNTNYSLKQNKRKRNHNF